MFGLEEIEAHVTQATRSKTTLNAHNTKQCDWPSVPRFAGQNEGGATVQGGSDLDDGDF
jgi:hypothetical protein